MTVNDSNSTIRMGFKRHDSRSGIERHQNKKNHYFTTESSVGTFIPIRA